MVEYSVKITEQRADDKPVAEVYTGPSYQEAFDFAVKARGVKEWRGKWICLSVGNIHKWAEIK